MVFSAGYKSVVAFESCEDLLALGLAWGRLAEHSGWCCGHRLGVGYGQPLGSCPGIRLGPDDLRLFAHDDSR